MSLHGKDSSRQGLLHPTRRHRLPIMFECHPTPIKAKRPPHTYPNKCKVTFDPHKTRTRTTRLYHHLLATMSMRNRTIQPRFNPFIRVLRRNPMRRLPSARTCIAISLKHTYSRFSSYGNPWLRNPLPSISNNINSSSSSNDSDNSPLILPWEA
ncbi:hypothetical protein FKP32DRAFT_1671838 [Trametes sanguinea]|nr:hypothetical protein FKP32DRAFT_1671838 [Trametes sanguinea]